MNAIESDVMMTVEEVSAYFKVAPSTVYRLAQEGTLPGKKVGGMWRFSREQLAAWFRERPVKDRSRQEQR